MKRLQAPRDLVLHFIKKNAACSLQIKIRAEHFSDED